MKKIPLKSALIDILARPNVACRKPIYDKYDKNVQGNTAYERGQTAASVITPFRDFDELSEAGANVGVAIGTGGNPYRAKIDPELAAEYAIAQAALQVACVGGDWLGATDCLNFGNPEKPDQMAELVSGIDGVKTACERLSIPIVSGNVSLYNETHGQSIPPSALVSVFARVNDVEAVKPTAITESGQKIWYIGLGLSLTASELYQLAEAEDTRLEGLDYDDFQALIDDIKGHLADFSSIQILGPGGVWAALVAGVAQGQIGFKLDLDGDLVTSLLGEGLGVVVTSDQDLSLLDGARCLGTTTAETKVVIEHEGASLFELDTVDLIQAWKKGLVSIF